MWGNVLSAMAAFAIAGILVMAVEASGNPVCPLRAGLDPGDWQPLKEYIQVALLDVFLFVLLAHSDGLLAGGSVFGLLSGPPLTRFAVSYGILALIMAGLTLIAIPHPIWIAILSLVLPIPLSLPSPRIATGIHGTARTAQYTDE
jgi:hypothetical protein